MASCEEAHEMYRRMKLPEITENIIHECLGEIPMEVDRGYIRTFILCGQAKVREMIDRDGAPSEDNAPGLML